jgi:uncharacterized membrane protein YcjF (UPF0283 family)
MKKLFALVVALLAVVGAVVVAALFFWRRNRRQSWRSSLSSAKDVASLWGKTAAGKAEDATDRLSATTSDATNAASTGGRNEERSEQLN